MNTRDFYKEELKKLESKLDSVNLLEKKIGKIFNFDDNDNDIINIGKRTDT